MTEEKKGCFIAHASLTRGSSRIIGNALTLSYTIAPLILYHRELAMSRLCLIFDAVPK